MWPQQPVRSTLGTPTAPSMSPVDNYRGQLNKLLTKPESFQQTPGYQFAFDQGQQAVTRSGAARGQIGSGNVMTALSKYGQGMANQEYGNQVDRMRQLLGQEQQYDLGNKGIEQQRYGTDMGFAGNMFGQMNQFQLGQEQNQIARQREQRGVLSDLMSYDLGNRRLGVDENQNAALMLRSLVV